MEEKTVYTKEEVVKCTIEILESIMVPGKYMLQIGRPLSGAIDNLHLLYNGMTREKKAQEEKEAEEKETPELTLVEEEAEEDEHE